MNEEQTKHSLITPALQAAGWDTAPFKLVLEQQVAPGRVAHDGVSHHPEYADYVLMYNTRRLAVIEAKSTEKHVDAAEAQARHYAEALGVRFAFATNGYRVRAFDLVCGTMTEEASLHFPSPYELLDSLKQSEEETPLEKVCREIPFSLGTRYYQERAVEAIIKSIGKGNKNVLITLATGTGKTFIAYQLVKKLVEAKWCRENGKTVIGSRKPRVLFLADRNILADQALESFKDKFAPNECYRLEAGNDNPPKDRTVYFTLYQTLLGKSDGDDLTQDDTQVKYQQFAADFFDLVIIDECHRGGANDESVWRAVLNYFKGACHVGLTATPKCDVNGSTYGYFGEPVYQYSLKQGIADGFLTPYRVKNCISTVSTYHYEVGDWVSDEERVDREKTYTNDQLERERIRIRERDRHFVQELFKVMPADQKALVFCVTQEHASRITHLIREEAAKYGQHDIHYCERVTAEDGEIGEGFLKQFRNNENNVPTILTTSQKLSTGVDACNVRAIVLLKYVKSMVEFKQIVGRGTRLCEGKPFFTIYDFVGATEKFRDPDWDGPIVCPKCKENPCVCGDKPKKPCPVCGKLPCVCPPKKPEPCPVCGLLPCVCEHPPKEAVTVKLADGRVIASYWQDSVFFDDEMMTVAEFLTRFANAIREATKTPELLRECWADIDKRKDLIATMSDIGFNADRLKEIQRNIGRQDYDILDVMLDIAYNVTPVTRALRAKRAGENKGELTDERKTLFDVILANYVRDGVWTLTKESFRDLLKQRYASLGGAYEALGFRTPDEANAFYAALQHELYVA